MYSPSTLRWIHDRRGLVLVVHELVLVAFPFCHDDIDDIGIVSRAHPHVSVLLSRPSGVVDRDRGRLRDRLRW
jgi:hypothetical protein